MLGHYGPAFWVQRTNFNDHITLCTYYIVIQYIFIWSPCSVECVVFAIAPPLSPGFEPTATVECGRAIVTHDWRMSSSVVVSRATVNLKKDIFRACRFEENSTLSTVEIDHLSRPHSPLELQVSKSYRITLYFPYYCSIYALALASTALDRGGYSTRLELNGSSVAECPHLPRSVRVQRFVQAYQSCNSFDHPGLTLSVPEYFKCSLSDSTYVWSGCVSHGEAQRRPECSIT